MICLRANMFTNIWETAEIFRPEVRVRLKEMNAINIK
jgi:hypothetical protein